MTLKTRRTMKVLMNALWYGVPGIGLASTLAGCQSPLFRDLPVPPEARDRGFVPEPGYPALRNVPERTAPVPEPEVRALRQRLEEEAKALQARTRRALATDDPAAAMMTEGEVVPDL